MKARTSLLVPLLLTAACSSLRFVDDDGEPSGGAPLGGAPEGVGGGAAARSIEVALEVDPSFSANQVLVLVNAPDGALKQVLNGSSLPADVEVDDGDLVSFLSRTTSSEIHSFRVTPDVVRIAKQIEDKGPLVTCNAAPMQLVVEVPEVAGAIGYELDTDTGDMRAVEAPGTVTMDVTDCDGDGSFDLFAFATTGAAVVSYELVQDIPFEPGASMTLALGLSETARVPVDMVISGLGEAQTTVALSGWRHVPAMQALEQTNGAEWGSTAEAIVWHSNVIDPGPGYGRIEIDVSAQFSTALGCHRRASLTHIGHAPPASFDATRLAEVEPAGLQSWAFADDAGGPGDVVWQTWRSDPDANFSWTTWEDANAPALEITFPELPQTLPDGFSLPTDELRLNSLGNQDFLERESYAESVATPGAETRQWRAASYDCNE